MLSLILSSPSSPGSAEVVAASWSEELLTLVACGLAVEAEVLRAGPALDPSLSWLPAHGVLPPGFRLVGLPPVAPAARLECLLSPTHRAWTADWEGGPEDEHPGESAVFPLRERRDRALAAVSLYLFLLGPGRERAAGALSGGSASRESLLRAGRGYDHGFLAVLAEL